MNLQYYYNYVTIVEEGSLTAASRKLHIAQPALSNQVKAMEQKYGTRLFFRGARRLELTDAGMILYQKAKRICEIEQGAQSEIASGFSGQKGTLRVGVSPFIAGGKINDVLLAFAQKYPETEIKYLEAGVQDLCKMLQNGIIEVAVVKIGGELPENVKLLAQQTSSTLAVYRPDAFLDRVKKDYVTISQLSGLPIAMEEMFQGPVAGAFKAKDAQLYVKSLSSNPRFSLQMARTGLAVALLSSFAVDGLQEEGLVAKPIRDGESMAARYCLVSQKGNYRSQVVNNYIAMMAEAFHLELAESLNTSEEDR